MAYGKVFLKDLHIRRGLVRKPLKPGVRASSSEQNAPGNPKESGEQVSSLERPKDGELEERDGRHTMHMSGWICRTIYRLFGGILPKY